MCGFISKHCLFVLTNQMAYDQSSELSSRRSHSLAAPQLQLGPSALTNFGRFQNLINHSPDFI